MYQWWVRISDYICSMLDVPMMVDHRRGHHGLIMSIWDWFHQLCWSDRDLSEWISYLVDSRSNTNPHLGSGPKSNTQNYAICNEIELIIMIWFNFPDTWNFFDLQLLSCNIKHLSTMLLAFVNSTMFIVGLITCYKDVSDSCCWKADDQDTAYGWAITNVANGTTLAVWP